MLPAFDKQGHRGCRGLMPENTIPAMLRAIDLGVTTLEMDICFTEDSQAILSHEPFYNHDITTLPDGGMIEVAKERDYKIFRMTYTETQQYDVGMKLHPRFPRQEKLKVTKPLLKDVIAAAEIYARQKKSPPLFYNIETKTQPSTDNIYHPAPQPFVNKLMEVIDKTGVASRVIIQSFDFRTLQILHHDRPEIKTAMLIEDYDHRSLDEQLTALGFTPTIYSPAYELVTQSLVEACHRHGMKIIPWTVNELPEIQRLQKLGVDGIITDFPDLFNR